MCLRGVCAHLEQHIGEIAVGELEVPLIVELEQRRTVGMLLLQVKIVHFRFVRGVSALLANVHLSDRSKRNNIYITRFLIKIYLSPQPDKYHWPNIEEVIINQIFI